MNPRAQPTTDPAGYGEAVEARLQERIVQFVLDTWMNVPAEHESSRSFPATFGAHTPPAVTSCTEVGTASLQPYADRVGPQDRVFAARINDGGITATALVAYRTRDDRLELLHASCDWPAQGQQGELDATLQLALAR